MKPSLLLIASLAALSAFRASAHEPAQITPISWVLATQHNGGVDDKRVVLVGRVIKPDQGSDWWFSDATGSVRLDTGDKELPVGRLLRVTGNIDQAKWGIGYLEVEVRHWEYADKTGVR
jgi:uncharacterized protein YdeI (BOF family)